MTKILLLGSNQALSYNTPLLSRYDLVRVSNINQSESRKLIAAWQPEWLQYVLIHAVGQVLYTDQPWIYTFDPSSNQFFSQDKNQQLLNRVREWLGQNSCKKIVVNSNYEKKQFVKLHQDWSGFEQLSSKIEVVYPSCNKIASTPKSWSAADGYLHLLCFGGFECDKEKNHIIALNLAQKALVAQLPLKIHFVFQPTKTDNRELWQSNNLIYQELSDQKDILQLMSQCHFQLLTPLTAKEAYTDFYQMLSGFSVGTPAITTNLELLTEFNHNEETGYLLKLDQVSQEWLENNQLDRNHESQPIFSDIYNNLSEQTLQILQEFWLDPERAVNYETLSEKALARIEHDQFTNHLDYLYAKAIEIDTTFSSSEAKPFVSIVIPLYNGELYIKEAIESILQQTYDHYEIVVIDDGSVDHSRSALEPYLDRIRYIYQKNQGVSKARNKGIAESRGELIAFLDADDFFLSPTKLEEEVACFRDRPNLGLLHGSWSQVDQEGNKIIDERCWLEVPRLDLATWISHKLVLPSAMVVRRSWLARIGGFDPRFCPSEDVDLIMRLLLLGCEAMWLPKITVGYRQHATNATRQIYKRGSSLETVINSFFVLPDLPDEILELKNQVIFYDFLWLAWCFYDSQDLVGMAKYIQKAFEISPYLYSDSIYRCVNQFNSLNQKYVGKKIDSLSLTNSPEWRRIIQSNPAIK